MARNPIPEQNNRLFTLVEDMIDGLTGIGAATGVAQNTTAVLRRNRRPLPLQIHNSKLTKPPSNLLFPLRGAHFLMKPNHCLLLLAAPLHAQSYTAIGVPIAVRGVKI